MTDITIPFLTITLVAQDQAGTIVSEALLRVYKWEGEPLTSGNSITVPLGAGIAVRGMTGDIQGPWQRVSVTDAKPEIIVPFWSAPLLAQDQTGQSVPGAQLHVHRVEGSPVDSGTVLTAPKNATIAVRGTLGAIQGPWLRVLFTDGLTEVIVPFWSAPILAQDQTGQSVPGTQLHVHRVKGSPFDSGTVLTVPKNAKIAVRGTLGAIQGPWLRVLFTDGLTEVIVPFWTTTLTARDQFGENVENAQLHVYRVEHSPFHSGAALTLPKNARVSVRGAVDTIRGPWEGVVINESVTEIIVPFWTTQLGAQDQQGTNLPQAQIHIYRWAGGALTPRSTVTLPKGSSASIRGFADSQRSPWMRFRFTDGLTEAVITIGS